MKKSFKRWICCFLTVLMLVSTMMGSVTVSAASTLKKGSTFTSGQYKYKVTTLKGKTGEVALVGVTKKSVTSVKIPNTVTKGKYKFSVTSIADGALKGCTKLKTVTTNKNLKKIGKNAFSGCSKLVKLNIKSTKLTSVGKNALKGINKKAVIQVPKAKKTAYKKILKNKGQKSTVKVTVSGTTAVAPSTEAPETEAPKTEAPETEAPKTEAPTEAPETEAPKTEAPTETPETEAPKTEAPTETPETEAPKTEAPTETPETEAPKTEAPTETPETETPKTEAPTEAPKPTTPPQADTPQQSGPSFDEPGFDEPQTSAPTPSPEPETKPTETEEPKTEAPTGTPETEAPTEAAKPTTPPQADTPQQSGPSFDEPSVDEPQTSEPTPSPEPETKPAETEEPKTEAPTGTPETEAPTEAPKPTTPPQADAPQQDGPSADEPQTSAPTTPSTETETKPNHTHANVSNFALEKIPDAEPTCTQPGHKNCWKCTVCGEEFHSIKYHMSEESKPTGHQFTKSETNEATCTAEGSVVKICETCEAREVEKVLPKKSHTWGDMEVIQKPNCKQYGIMAQKCKVCGAINEEGQEIVPADPKNLDYHTLKDVEDIPATCTGWGKTNRQVCEVCGQEFFGLTRDLNPLGHDFQKIEEKKATCTEDGYIIKKCQRKGCMATETEVIPKTGHKWSKSKRVIKEPTCKEEGLKALVCENEECGAQKDSEFIPKTSNHNYTSVVLKEATCSEMGVTAQRCTVCEKIEHKEMTPKKPHTFTKNYEVKQNATCTEAGSKSRTCDVCGAVETKVIPMTGHEFSGDEVQREAATCTERGYVKKKCTKCGAEGISEYIPSLGHDFSEGDTCTRCGCKKDADKYSDGYIWYSKYTASYGDAKKVIQATKGLRGGMPITVEADEKIGDYEFSHWNMYVLDGYGEDATICATVQNVSKNRSEKFELGKSNQWLEGAGRGEICPRYNFEFVAVYTLKN